MQKYTTVSKRIPEFFKPYPATTTPIAVARVLGAQMQEMNRMSMQTLKAVQKELSTHTLALFDNEAIQRKAADDSLAARIATLEHAATLLPCSEIPCSPAPEPPAPEPPALTPAAAPSPRKQYNYTQPYVKTYYVHGKARYYLNFHTKTLDDIIDPDGSQRKKNRFRIFTSLKVCLNTRDRMILAAGYFISQKGVRPSLRKLKV